MKRAPPPLLRIFSMCFLHPETPSLASRDPVVSMKKLPGTAPTEVRNLAYSRATVVLPIHAKPDCVKEPDRIANTYQSLDCLARQRRIAPLSCRYSAG